MNIQERNRRIDQYRRLPYWVVRRYRAMLAKYRIRKEDALQACRVGLIAAANTWEDGRGANFTTYAVLCCKRSLFTLCRNENLIRVPQGDSAKRRAWREQARRIVFLGGCDTGAVDDHPRGWADVPDPRPEKTRDFFAEEAFAYAFRTMLNPRLMTIIRLYYYENRTLAQIGEQLGITAERVKQLRDKGIQRLRHMPCSVGDALLHLS